MILRTVGAAYRGLEQFMLWLSYVALFAMTVGSAVDALLRYVMNRSLPGMDGLVQEIFMPALVYFAVTHVYKNDGHIRITLVSNLIPGSVRQVLYRIFDTLAACILLLICYGATMRTIQAYVRNEYSTNSLGYLIAPSIALVAIGSGLLVLRVLYTATTGRRVADALAVYEV